MYKKIHHQVKNVLMQKYAELKSEVLSHKIIYLLLSVIILLAIFLRVYRTNELLWFFYDQGRDALVIWEFIKNGKPFLIGPITGLVGIYRGPFYYYLISPAYFISNGNPGGAAAFLGFLNALGLIIVFALGSKISRWVGLVAAFLGAVSFNWIRNDRWLSNPSPISFFGPLALLLIYLSIKQPMKYLFWVGVVFGLNFQL